MSETNQVNAVPGGPTEGVAKAPQPKVQVAQATQTQEQKEAASLAIKQAELLELELKKARLEVEEKELAVRNQKANLVDMEERLAERELKRQNIRQEFYTKGDTLKALETNKIKQQKRCNHKKGGNGAAGVVGGKGDSSDYALLIHTFANGDVWVKCLRCHKTWKPPIESDYKTQEAYNAAKALYEVALEYPTKNTPSGGVQFRYSDGGAYYREQTRQVQMG